jgi:sugar O-acyltransferase (sialic acid O-acetyltransferase NeuD family)
VLPKLFIWGAGGHARVVADIVRLARAYEVAGFLIDRQPRRDGATFCGAPLFGGDDLERLGSAGFSHALVAVGDCAARLRLAEAVSARGFVLATAVHPRATLAADVAVGLGTVVAAGAAVNPGACLGANVVNTGTSIDHDCRLADGVHVAPGARLAGRVTVGRGAWVGLGALVKQEVTIGAGTLIEAGAVVVRDLPDNVLAYGVPARIIRGLQSADRATG